MIERSPTAVGPSDLFALLPPERWYAEAVGFADSASELFQRLANQVFAPTWPRAKAAAFLFGHSIELFLKASIAQSGARFPWGHDLAELHDRYREHFPEPEFAFQSNVSGFIKAHELVRYYEFLKYPERVSDLTKTWEGGLYVEVTLWAQAVTAVRADMARLWPLIMNKHPRDLARFTEHPDGEFEERGGKKKNKPRSA
jgi:hypothetical protein